jgi:uncharacterized protein YcaQ
VKITRELSLVEARAAALRAQGFGARWEKRDPARLLEHLGAIQLDSVNVLARSQDLIPFARMGPCAVARMHAAVYGERRGFEYWGHAASWLPMADFRWFLARKRKMREESRRWWRDARAKNAHLYDGVLARVREEGPLTSAAFEDPRGKRGSWWDWKPAKLVLEDLFDQGLLMAAGRTAGFARLYDLPERVLPSDLDTQDPGDEATARHLFLRGLAALGVATAREAADYFRMRPAAWRPAQRALAHERLIVPVRVEGWAREAWALPDALADVSTPRHRPALLSPFDNLVWERARTEALFGFRYRISIYTPLAQRTHGYYVLPLLARGRVGGRADLKLDRPSRTLQAHGLWIEDPKVTPADAASALVDLARHLGAERVTLARAQPRGTLAEVRRLVRDALA